MVLRWLPHAIVISLSLPLFFVAHTTVENETSLKEDIHLALATDVQAQIQSVFDSELNRLKGVRGYFAGSTFVDDAEFLAYIQGTEWLTDQPGLQAAEFVRVVEHEDLLDFEAERRAYFAEQGIEYRVHAFGPVDPHDVNGTHYIADYLVPLGPNIAALGLDNAPSAPRVAAIERSFVTGEVFASEPIVLAQTGTPGFLVFLPIYEDNQPYGLALAVYEVQSLIFDVLPLESLELDISLQVGHEVIYGDGGEGIELPIDAFGSKWLLVVPEGALHGDSFGAWIQHNSPYISVGVGLLAGIGLVTYLQRRSDHLQVEQELKSTQDAVQYGSKFLGLVNHELRTPLTPAKLELDMLSLEMSGPLNDDQKEVLSLVGTKLDQMVDTLESLQLVSHLDSGTLELKSESMDLQELVKEAAELVAQENPSVSMDLSLEPSPMVGDRALLLRAVVALLRNGAKSNPNGKLMVSLAANIFSVRDEGDGFKDEELAALFDRFEDFDGAQIIQAATNGLGLNIAKNVAELSGGTLKANSTGPGEGSEFILDFSNQRAEHSAVDVER